MKPFEVINVRKFVVGLSLLFVPFISQAQEGETDYSHLINFGFQWKTGMFFQQDWGPEYLSFSSEFDGQMTVNSLQGRSQTGGILFRFGENLDLQLGISFKRRTHSLSYTGIFAPREEATYEEEAIIRYFGAYLGAVIKVHKHIWVGLTGRYLPSISYRGDFKIRNSDGSVVDHKVDRSASPMTPEFNPYIGVGVSVASPIRITPNVILSPKISYEANVKPLFDSNRGVTLSNGHIEKAELKSSNLNFGFKFLIYFTYMEKMSQGR